MGNAHVMIELFIGAFVMGGIVGAVLALHLMARGQHKHSSR